MSYEENICNYALEYLKRGLSVIPIRRGDKKPLLESWKEYQERRATEEEIETWWKKWPEANIGIVTGKISGLIVLDIDGQEGLETIKAKNYPLPPTWASRTGGGGFHYLYKWPGKEIGNFARKLPGIDLRGDGGYVVAPPSIHASGKKYNWLIPPEGEELADPPDWLLELAETKGGKLEPEDWKVTLIEGQRNTELTRRAGSLLAKGIPAGEVLTMLKAWNTEHCEPPLPEEEVKSIVESIARREAAKPQETRKENGEEGADRKPVRQTSFFVNGETIFEQITVNGEHLFYAYNTLTGKGEVIHCFETEKEVITPITGEEADLSIKFGAVKLPSGVSEYGDTLTLLAEIEEHIYQYLDVSPNYLKFAAYYVLLSWLYDCFHTLPYLRALGDTGCGKSRFLDVIGGLCYKSFTASGCVTPAPIYRMIKRWQGTLVLDEADMKNSDEYNEVVTILNCGFERGRPVVRAVKDSLDKVQILPVYGPKVFATRRRFKDVALEARCLTEIMKETDRDDIPPVLGKKFFEEQQQLRNKLLLFRLRNYFKVDPEAGAKLNLDGIEPRLRQVSEAFASLFANEPEVLESYRQFIHAHQRELIEQRAATKTGQIVEALFELIEEKNCSNVATVATYMGDSEVATEISAGDIAEKTGISPQAVGAILKSLGLNTQQKRIDTKVRRVILVTKEKLEKLKRRYILPDDEDVATRTIESPNLATNATYATQKEEEFNDWPDDPPWEI